MRPTFLAGVTAQDDMLEVAHSRRKNVADLLEDLIFRDSRGKIWIAARGLRSDGASIPRPLWHLVGHPFEARYLPGAFLHDQPYQTGLRLTIDPEILDLVILDEMTPAEIVTLPRVEVLTDRYEVDRFALYEPVRANGNGEFRSQIIYRGVRAGGWRAWNAHERRRVAERRPFSMLHAA